MKKTYLLLVFITLIVPSTIHSMTAYMHLVEELATDVFEESDFNVYTDHVDYIAGGVTIVYPVSFFTSAPFVIITLQLLNQVYAVTLLFTVMITASSAVSTTIRVDKELLGVVAEALTDDVTLHILAIGPSPKI